MRELGDSLEPARIVNLLVNGNSLSDFQPVDNETEEWAQVEANKAVLGRCLVLAAGLTLARGSLLSCWFAPKTHFQFVRLSATPQCMSSVLIYIYITYISAVSMLGTKVASSSPQSYSNHNPLPLNHLNQVPKLSNYLNYQKMLSS